MLDADDGTSYVLSIQDKFTSCSHQREFHRKAFLQVRTSNFLCSNNSFHENLTPLDIALIDIAWTEAATLRKVELIHHIHVNFILHLRRDEGNEAELLRYFLQWKVTGISH